MDKTMNLPPLRRMAEMTLKAAGEGEDEDTIELTFSSEEPYERWFGIEILGHKDTEVDLDWMKSGRAPLLVDHDKRVDSQVGVIARAWLEDRRGKAVARFGKNARSAEIAARVKAGDLGNVSVGYRVDEMELVATKRDGPDQYRVTRWHPYEASIITIPADPTVGVGRGDGGEEKPVRIVTPQPNPQSRRSRMDPQLENIPPPAPANTGWQASDLARSEPAAETPDQILAGERKRTADIEALGARFNRADLARQHIGKGTSLEVFRGILIEVLGAETVAEKNLSANSIGLSKKEAQSFRFTRLIAGMMDPRNHQLAELAKFEMEVVMASSQKSGKDTAKRGYSIPIEVLRQPLVEMQRDLLVGTATAGGHTVATELMSQDFITLLRNRMMVKQMGARMLSGLEGNIAIPRQTGGATGFWVAENTNVTESQQAFDQVTMSPKTFGAFTDWSRKLMLQSTLDVEAFVRDDLATVLALGVDLAALHGTGASNQPLGLSGQTGLNLVPLGTNGAVPTWANVVQMETEVATDNADVGNLGYLTNAKVRGKLKTVEKAATTGQFIWSESFDPNGFNQVNGYRSGVSNQVRSDLTKGSSSGICSAVFYGNWADLIVGSWSGIDILIDPYTGGIAGTVRVIAFQDVDVACRHGESFSYIPDALTT